MPGCLPSISTRLLPWWFLLCWLGLIGPGWSRVAAEFGESTRTSRPTSGQEGNGGLMLESFPYEKAGNRTGVLYGGTGRRLVSTYDALQRLQTCTETQDSVPVDAAHPAALTTYGYDVGSRILLKTLPNGTAEAKGYDAAGRTTTQITRSGPASGNTVFSTTTSRYDRFGRLAWQKEIRPATGVLPAVQRLVENTYDLAHRLLVERSTDLTAAGAPSSAPQETVYTYDKGNNRTSLTRRTAGTPAVVTSMDAYAVGIGTETWATEPTDAPVAVIYQANQLRKVTGSSGPTYYRYDKTGNRIQRYTPATGEDIRYLWDRAGRLRGVSRCIRAVAANGTTPAIAAQPARSWLFGYDHRTRRISRQGPGSGATADPVEIDSFSGGTAISRWTASTPDPLPANRTLAHETIRGSDYGGGVGGVLYTIQPPAPGSPAGTPGTAQFYEYGARGDVTGQSNRAGTSVFRAVYQAFGNYVQSGTPGPGRQRASTKDEESELGLLNEGFRYREVATGAFLSRDPAGFVDGPNLYAYVRQNPWSSFDPEGLYDVDDKWAMFKSMASDFASGAWEGSVGAIINNAEQAGAEAATVRMEGGNVITAMGAYAGRMTGMTNIIEGVAGDKIDYHDGVLSTHAMGKGERALNIAGGALAITTVVVGRILFLSAKLCKAMLMM